MPIQAPSGRGLTAMDSSRTSPWLPRFAAFAAAFVGLVNIGSALTPNIRWRGHLLLQYEPVQAIRMFHALALPAGAALLLVSPYLLKRRRRAWQAAIVLMVALGLFDLLKGLDFEETLITLSVASALGFAGDAFKVHSDPITLRSALWRAPLLAVGGLALAVLASWASHPDSVQVTAVVTLLAVAYVIFRPLAGPRALPGPDSRAAVAQIVQDHGTDTLSFFKLRADKHYFFSDERDAFVAYRIENGVLLLSGDPVGAPHAFPGLIEQLKTFAETRGLRLGAVGAHERLCPLYEEFGLKTIYLGDEAIIELDKFSLEGRPIRKVRQSVTRLTKAGYTRNWRRSTGSTPRRSRRSSTCSSLAGRAPLSAGSRWRWTGSTATTRPRRSSCSRVTNSTSSAACSTSCRVTGARACRCRSCAATPIRRTA